MKLFSKILFFTALATTGSFLFPTVVFGSGFELLKSVDFGTVYYIDSQGARHPFPNETTYKSWYGQDFSKITTVSSQILANYPLGKNITIRPGTYLVKVRTAPQVYTVEQGGVLRELQNESIAEGIYGENWAQRVIDVPDVFFGDYGIGAPIVHDYTMPDSILYQDEVSGKYFYRNNEILQPFASIADVLANYFNLDFAKTDNRSYFIRQRPIVGLDKNVFNPVAEKNSDRRDCSVKNLKASVILLADKTYQESEVNKIQTLKKSIPDQFSWATNGLAEIDIDFPTSILFDDGYLLKKRNDGTAEVLNEVINTYYDNNPDIFDFIFVFTNFTIPNETVSHEIANFIPVSNKVEGLNKSLLNRSNVYGSSGKLKGIIMMGNVNKYDTTTVDGLDQALNIVLHEILHQWSAYINFTDENGNTSQALLRKPDLQHWNIYAGFISPLGGSGWVDNGDGTFTSGLLSTNSNRRPYSQLDLYLMGLVPKQFIDPIMYLEPEKPGEVGNTLKDTAK